MEIFEPRLLGENLYLHQRFTQCSKWSTSCKLFRCKYRFSPKSLGSNISMYKPIQDNDDYKPHAKNYSNLSMFTEVIAETRHNSPNL
jgi:hypothetical protein